MYNIHDMCNSTVLVIAMLDCRSGSGLVYDHQPYDFTAVNGNDKTTTPSLSQSP